MDRSPPISYSQRMIGRSPKPGTDVQRTTPARRTSLAELGGWRMLVHNPGLVLQTLRHGVSVGDDAFGNRYFEEQQVTRATGRKRRWVVYPGLRREASLVPPEWHAWLHYTTDAPIPVVSRPWLKPYQPNLTGTPAAYRPPGHDYESGTERHPLRAYEAWTPDS
jgi:NADH:ubiquinone oxidoreductase subunit